MENPLLILFGGNPVFAFDCETGESFNDNGISIINLSSLISAAFNFCKRNNIDFNEIFLIDDKDDNGNIIAKKIIQVLEFSVYKKIINQETEEKEEKIITIQERGTLDITTNKIKFSNGDVVDNSNVNQVLWINLSQKSDFKDYSKIKDFIDVSNKFIANSYRGKKINFGNISNFNELFKHREGDLITSSDSLINDYEHDSIECLRIWAQFIREFYNTDSAEIIMPKKGTTFTQLFYVSEPFLFLLESKIKYGYMADASFKCLRNKVKEIFEKMDDDQQKTLNNFKKMVLTEIGLSQPSSEIISAVQKALIELMQQY